VTFGRGPRSALPPAALALALLAGAAGVLRAQSASIATTADISTTALSIVALSQLPFGTVIPGTPVTINPQTSASAAVFEFHGGRNAQFNATFTLPTQLSTGPGGWTMPIAFGATSACERDRNQQAQCNTYDPHNALIQRIRNNPTPNDTYFVWLGGTVTPSPTQHPGVYRATVTISAFYTGL